MSVYLELSALKDESAGPGTDDDFDQRLLAGVNCDEDDDYDQAKAYNESDEEPDVADLVRFKIKVFPGVNFTRQKFSRKLSQREFL